MGLPAADSSRLQPSPRPPSVNNKHTAVGQTRDAKLPADFMEPFASRLNPSRLVLNGFVLPKDRIRGAWSQLSSATSLPPFFRQKVFPPRPFFSAHFHSHSLLRFRSSDSDFPTPSACSAPLRAGFFAPFVLFRGGRFTLEPKRDALEGESCERPAGGGSRPLPKPVPRPTFNHASRRPHPIKPHRASPRLLIRKLELPRRNLRGLPFRVRTVSDAPKAL